MEPCRWRPLKILSNSKVRALKYTLCYANQELVSIQHFLFEIFVSSLCSRTEFDEGENLLDSNSDAVAISIEDPISRPQKQKKSDGFTLNDEDPDVSDDQTKVWKRCRNVNYAKMSTF